MSTLEDQKRLNHGSINKKEMKKLEGLKMCQEYAESKGGQCLSSSFENNTTKMLWKCSNDKHDPWNAAFQGMKYHGYWCGRCTKSQNYKGGKKAYTLEDCQEYAKEKGGLCLSTEYKNSETNMLWICEKGLAGDANHLPWEAVFQSMKSRGSWCRKCKPNGNNVISLETCREYAGKREGKCLSDVYEKTEKMTWMCKYGHTFTGKFVAMKCKSSVAPWCTHKDCRKI